MTRTFLDACGLKIGFVLVTEQVGSLPVAGQCSDCPQGSSAFWRLVLPAHCDKRGHCAMSGTTEPHACGCPAQGCEGLRGSQSPSSALYCSGVRRPGPLGSRVKLHWMSLFLQPQGWRSPVNGDPCEWRSLSLERVPSSLWGPLCL